MTKKTVNVPASIHQRLLNLARSTQRAFNDLLYIYANERFLYRLSKSTHASRFILKGAMAILNLDLEHPRYTRDIDLLGFAEISVPVMEQIIHEICETKVIDDGLVFDSKSIRGKLIKIHDEYPGVRVKFNASLGNARIPNLQVDIGIGDAVYPQARIVKYHTLLNLPEASIRIYQPETILSEKVHAMVQHGFLNSRMKDIYDIWLIASHQKIEGTVFSKAIRTTFENRQTSFPESLAIFDTSYQTQMRIAAWKSIGYKLQFSENLPELSTVIELINLFIMPVITALYQNQVFSLIWEPAKEWAWH